jgi:phage shock protein E
VNFNAAERQRSRIGGCRRFAVGLTVGAALLLGSVSCSSEDSGTDPAAAEKRLAQDTASFTRLDPEQFEARMGNADAHVINVHVPYEGEIENTDAFIPFDRILGDARLPEDKGSEILLYCKSGRMSAEAGEALGKAGYTDVSHLEGGFKAWEEAGNKIVHRPQSGEPAGTGAH